jgi:hypothetical protein
LTYEVDAASYTAENKLATQDRPMVPLYAARMRDLGPGDFVKVECMACGHDELIPASALLQGMRPPPFTPVVDLQPRLRCRECDAKGRAVVSIKWAGA